jgi:hypothetical protein
MLKIDFPISLCSSIFKKSLKISPYKMSCASLTLKKVQCKNKAIKDSRYCSLHNESIKSSPIQIQPKHKIEFICNRQDLLENIKLRKLGLESYILDRLDMYWIKINSDGDFNESTIFSVEPWYSEKGFSYSLSHQYGKYTSEARKIANDLFLGSKEEANMKQWTESLYKSGYFKELRNFMGKESKNTNVCPHCKSYWEVGTSHDHIMFDERIVAHCGLLYEKALSLGFKISWYPGTLSTTPSMEQEGLISRVTIQKQ